MAVEVATGADVTPVAPTLVDGVALALRAEGIKVVTNLPDDVTIVIAESFLRNGFRVVRPRHEQNVVLAADGYTRASGLPAVCVVGPGPGIAQTGTGLVTASRRRSPVLVIVGERPSIRGDDKDLDIQRFVESTGARYLEMRSELTLADDLREAMRQVRLRRGPVVLNLVDVRLLEKPLSSAWSYSPTEDVVPTGVELDRSRR